jgi:hypothetical protein
VLLLWFFLFLPLEVLFASQQPLVDRLHICTVASHRNENLEKLILSCQKHHIELEIVGLGLPYEGNGTKLLRMHKYIKTLDDDDIAMFVDAFDVIIIADKEIILEKFLAMKGPIVFSTEKGCFPFPHLIDEYPQSSSPFRFLNSGAYIGYVKDLKKWLRGLKPFDLQKGDQGQITVNYLSNKDSLFLDDKCEIFLSLYQVSGDEIVIDENKRVVHCVATDSEPCVIHANGKSFDLWDIIYQKLVIN